MRNDVRDQQLKTRWRRTCFILAVASVLNAMADCRAQSGRVSRDLQVLYLFDEGRGTVVHDHSGIKPPLHLTIENPDATQWSADGLTVHRSTQLKSEAGAVRLMESISRSGAITVEAWIKPADTRQTGPARIVSISADASRRNVTLGQQGDLFDVRLRTSATSENGLPSVATMAGSATMKPAHVVYSRDAMGTAQIFLNGVAAAKQYVAGNLANWDSQFALVLGNEASGDRPWLGRLQLVAIYSCALTEDEVKQNHAAISERYKQLAMRLPPAAKQDVDFVKHVQPIFREHCFECHAAGNEEGGLNLAMRARFLEGGEHGPVVERGRSVVSPLIHLVAGIDADRRMPPEGAALSQEQVGILRAWIDQGANWPAAADVPDPRLERARQHWAFRRLAERQPPNTEGNWPRTDIDRFILDKLTRSDLSPGPPQDARRLARRIYFDLVGLPPTPEQIERFVTAAAGDRSAAITALVDQLLATQHYGERWGRHWLDVVRYADSDGQEADRDRPQAWRFRDFVIRAFNDDMPFDTFVRWQIAGDEYEPENADAIVATGFLTAGPHTVLGDTFLEEERLRNRYNELDDIVSTLGTSLLGLTVGCARCHDHKYDAISSREYYRLVSVFHSGDRVEGKLPDGGEGLFFKDFGPEPRTTWLFRRGDFADREIQVRFGFPAILSEGTDADFYRQQARSEVDGSSSTLQRRALADWITDTQRGGGALLARVFVNRIWQHHFGRGLVRTESDFGVRGETPTHPELLEWLARDFVDHGWKIKRLHRMILNSATWQQGHEFDAAKAKKDPENRLLWRMTPRRLEAEILRDAMLAVSGTLNVEGFGPGFKPPIPAEAIVARNLKDGGYPKDAQDSEQTRRRSVYMFHKRVVPYPLFQVFDRPDLLQSCGQRQDTTVAPQALALLNDAFVRNRAHDYARKLLATHESNDQALVSASFAEALGRSATKSEACIAFIQSQSRQRKTRDEQNVRLEAVADYCQSLFGLNEFIYVD